jgi:hypothetical protein
MQKLLGALCVAILLSGCASTPTLDKTATVPSKVLLASVQFVQMQARVGKVAYRLATKGKALCSNTEPRAPLRLYSAKAAGGVNSLTLDALYRIYGLDNHVRILNVLTGPPAIEGALKRSDRIISINDEAVDDDDPVDAEQTLERAISNGKSFEIVVLQDDGAKRSVTITPATACSGQIAVLATPDATTNVVDYAGDAVGVPADLVKYFSTDDELAFLVGRQLYYMGTSASVGRKAAGYSGAALDGVMRFFTFGVANAFLSLSHEGIVMARMAGRSSADLFALKLMQAAGYDVHSVPNLWHRIDEMPTDKRPDNPTLDPSESRRAAVEKAIKDADAPPGVQAKASSDVQ